MSGSNGHSTRRLELENAFFNDGYTLAAYWLKNADEFARLFRALDELHRILDAFIDMFLETAEQSGTPAHCKKGCSWCCHQTVYAQDHEIRYLKNWMFDNLQDEEIQLVHLNARKKWESTSILAKEERFLHKEACPMLKDGACLVYSARPVACRIYLSYDRESCKKEFEDPGDKTSFPKAFDFPLRAGKKMHEGFVFRLEELGINVKELPFEQGILGK